MKDPLSVPDYSTPNKKKRLVETECRKLLRAAESINENMGHFLDGIYGVRRTKAILNYMDRAENEFRSFGLLSLHESFAKNELMPYDNYNHIDVDCDLRIGAALWILEKLRAAGKLGEAYDYLPDVSGDPDIWYLPMDFGHPCFDNDLIQSLIYVLSTRYGKKEHCVITKENAERKEPGEMYRCLLKLLPAEDVKKACAEFRDKLWELETRFMKGQGYYDREIRRAVRDAQNLQKGTFTGPFATPAGGSPMMSPGMTGTPEGITGAFGGNRAADIAMHTQELIDQSNDFSLQFNRYLGMSQKAIRRETGSREVAEALSGFTVNDPYELCFALFYLMDTGDDSVWLMRSGSSLMLCALRMLPWYVDQEDWSDEEWDAWYEGMPYNRNGWLEQEKPEEEIDFYHEKHGDRNLAQVIYDLCRTVVPTGLHPFEGDRKRLVEEGMDENTARRITDTAELLFLYEFQAKQGIGNAFSWEEDEEEEEEDEPTETAANTPMPKLGGYWGKVAADLGIETASEDSSTEAVEAELEKERLKEELDNVKGQLKNLKNALAVARQESGIERARYERELKGLKLEHRELADLRELVFNSELSENERERRERPEKEYSYPYSTKKRTVVFGGHDSFLRAFKPMLPDVKFVDAGNLTYSPEIIRNADVVWIQNNCISHSQYWSIVKTCKQAGVQMRYFGFASAEKCAEQLVTEDLK